MMGGTAHRRRDVMVWLAAAMTRLVGAIALANLVWFATATGSFLFFIAMGWDPNRTAKSVQTMWAGAFFFALPAFVLSGILYAIGRHFTDEQLWRSDLRRGTATVHDLSPGYTSSNNATQALTCRLEIQVAGTDPMSGHYRADIGPLDAPRFVEGASFACEVSPALPEGVRLWLIAGPDSDQLTGRYRDFRPVQPGRS